MAGNRTRTLAALSLFAVLPGLLAAAEVTGLVTFQNGTVANADTVNENFAALQLAVDDNHDRLSTLESVEPWRAVTYETGWVTYGSDYAPAGYYKDPTGFVHLRGLVKDGLAGTTRCIFTLPAGYRPAYRLISNPRTSDGTGRIDVLTNGCVVAYSVNNAWVSLENIGFRAEN